MAANLQTIRELALGLPEVDEGVCFGTPAFYLRGKLLLRLREDGESMMVKFPPEEREEALAREPDLFSITEHYEKHPVILVDLTAVPRDRLSELIERGWRMLASRRQIEAWDATRD